jgi:TrmH family RNA methyltransferase
VKHLRRLAHQRAARDTERLFVVEGPKLVDQALDAGWVEATFASRTHASRYPGAHVVADGVLDRVLDTVTSQGVAAIARQRTVSLGDLSLERPLLVLAGVSDPGNAGTLVRCAEAAGAAAVLFSDGGVDPFSPKCVRSSAGSIFRVPVVSGGMLGETLEQLGARGVRRVGTRAGAGESYDRAVLTGPLALVLGSEAHGLPQDTEPLLDAYVHIPMTGRVESLNVAMVGSVLLFESMRQRSSAR